MSLKTAAKAFVSCLPPRLRGRISFMFFTNAGWPMNGQAHRLEIARSIMQHCEIEHVIETGTFLGTTTTWLASFGLPVDTVEIDAGNYEFSRRRLAPFKQVRCHLGSSPDILSALKDDPAITSVRLFIYLDAHWQDYLPLADELRIILRHMPKAVVMIDDFAVPDDPGYGFDDSPGRSITLDYLAASDLPAFTAFWPTAPSRWETGARRGCIVLSGNPDLTSILRSLPCLRSFQQAFMQNGGVLLRSSDEAISSRLPLSS